ncbi:pre-mRNA 3'-end-processing factor FIP1 [Adelges cooleyi]|uniref:pre-mRNA 3'-end-processing factor FIP1 n=1 Tax=Adelges cooleyi TaxID=133065 RepID=UPI0021802DB1|nr:pre-mRNA 3'-end-processing factor FIP1 [Adelges cooleyi]
MADPNSELAAAPEQADDDQWLYGDSNSNLDSVVPTGALIEDVPLTKPAEMTHSGEDEESRLMEFLANPGPGNVDIPPPVKELSNDLNRPRSPEAFFNGTGFQSESLSNLPDGSLETNIMETTEKQSESLPEQVPDENDDEKQAVSSEDSEDDSDDDVVVAAGNFTLSALESNMAQHAQQNNASPSTTGINLKRNNLLSLTNSAGLTTGNKQQGKFNVDDFESVGSINGVPSHEYSIETTEEKPWLKPGADITDYFNYGFNENTWLAYCERQRKMRCNESLVGMSTLAMHNQQISTSTANNMIPTIDVKPKFQAPPAPPKENTIEVMTAERREYSRKHFPTPDLSVPPPIIPTTFDVPPPMIPGSIPPTGYGPPPPINVNFEPEYYPHEPDPYYNTFEPTQDMQWNQSWNSNVKSIENIPTLANGGDAYNKARTDVVRDKEYYAARVKKEPEDRGYERERDVRNRYRERDRERDRDRDRDRERERSRHRESDGVDSPETSYKEEREYKHKSHRHRSRSRSHEKRSRKHKSRSRSGSRHRHKKKKKKSEKNKDDDNSE